MKKITFMGNSITTVGYPIRENMTAPKFMAVDKELNEVTLDNFKDKIKIITSFISLDTPVCDLQVKEFNKKAGQMAEDIVIIGISDDLPFAQNKFCDANNINNIKILSDYKFSSFGVNYGLLIKELNLLARSILIIDKNDVIRYIQIVDEITSAPDYQHALDNLNSVIENPSVSPTAEVQLRCVSLKDLVLLSKERIANMFTQYPDWQLKESYMITKKFEFSDSLDAKYFLDLIYIIARDQNHYPQINLSFNTVEFILSTQNLGGLTENDFIMSKIIDSLYAEFREPLLK